MKLIRFELKSDPSVARSGMVHSGRIYETDGVNPTAVHEASDVKPLTPLARANSVRIFPPRYLEDPTELPTFHYLNPAALLGASILVPLAESGYPYLFESYLAAVVLGDGIDLEAEEADGFILGLTILNAVRSEGRVQLQGYVGGASHDAGMNIGPVLVTPDELGDFVIEEGLGSKFSLGVIVRKNGVEVGKARTDEFPFTLAQAIAAASQTRPLAEGDVIALGPLVTASPELRSVNPGDEFQTSIEVLGTLSTKILES